jgi:hypothetical protein
MICVVGKVFGHVSTRAVASVRLSVTGGMWWVGNWTLEASGFSAAGEAFHLVETIQPITSR